MEVVDNQTVRNFDVSSKQPFELSAVAPMDPPAFHSPAIPGSEMPQSPAIGSSKSTCGLREDVFRKCLASGMDSILSVGSESPASVTRSGSIEMDAESRWFGVLKISPSSAAVNVQKVYRSYRTRRRLADTAVVAEELWWQAIDYARLNYRTISVFSSEKPETVFSRWSRFSLFASKVGKGLSQDENAQKLAFQHWIEAIDPQHRYGHCLHLYYDVWCQEKSGQPFFYWLDAGDGKEVDLNECPRAKLRHQRIKYLGPRERESYEYIIKGGIILHKQTGLPLDTSIGSKKVKWIFVWSTSKKLYANEKKKGMFHHSSFLAGGATLAAGRLVAENGKLKSVSPYSGHYRPLEESLDSFLSFLKENGVDLDEVEICHANEDYDYAENGKSAMLESGAVGDDSKHGAEAKPQPPEPTRIVKPAHIDMSGIQTQNGIKRCLSGGIRSPRADIPKTAILQRINSKKAAKSGQLGYQVSLKWSTGVGPRIGCVADYPKQVRLQALEFMNLSPRPRLRPLPG